MPFSQPSTYQPGVNFYQLSTIPIEHGLQSVELEIPSIDHNLSIDMALHQLSMVYRQLSTVFHQLSSMYQPSMFLLQWSTVNQPRGFRQQRTIYQPRMSFRQYRTIYQLNLFFRQLSKVFRQQSPMYQPATFLRQWSTVYLLPTEHSLPSGEQGLPSTEHGPLRPATCAGP